MATLNDLWQEYFVGQAMTTGVDAWTITFMACDGDDVLVSMADPFTERHDEVFVEQVSADDLATFSRHYKARFMEQLPQRFGFFRPQIDRVLTEYPDWQTFYSAWLADDATLVQGNMPLLFDYPSQQEYRAMRLKDADYAGYRRLCVVLYQYRKRQFQRVFVQAVDDMAFIAIQQQIFALYQVAMDRLILPEPSIAR